ncbi:MAG TPA: hypothetical protein DCM08_08940 [Microscillaceae bacterium]|jgi:hypothetical protein|nr:hypothetical protein [Microscillaceae bacterium]
MNFKILAFLFSWILLCSGESLYAQNKEKSAQWLEGKLPLYLSESYPVISEEMSGGRVKITDNPEVELVNECVLAIRKTGDKASGYSLKLSDVISLEIIGETQLMVVTDNNGVSFVGKTKKKPKETKVLKVGRVLFDFNNPDQTEKCYRAIGHLSKKCGAKLVNDFLFDEEE